jgi:hypothetical protein
MSNDTIRIQSRRRMTAENSMPNKMRAKIRLALTATKRTKKCGQRREEQADDAGGDLSARLTTSVQRTPNLGKDEDEGLEASEEAED